MRAFEFFNKKALILVGIAFLESLIFFGIYSQNYFWMNNGHPYQDEVAYSVYQYNSVMINSRRSHYLGTLRAKEGRRVELAEIDHEAFGPPDAYRDVYDTIGYGVLIGLVWKVTHSLSRMDVQFLQVILFSCLMLLVYQIGLLFFDDKRVAFLSGIVLCFFLPAVRLNVYAMRDVWGVYATIMLLFGLTAYIHKRIGGSALIICGCVTAFMQFIRPSMFFAFVGVNIMALAYGFYIKNVRKVLQAVGIFVITNILFFWLPFVTYNKTAYGRYFVGTSGITLIETLGEYENPWGYVFRDSWYAEFIKQHGFKKGTAEGEDKGREIFFASVREHPWIYVKGVLKRIPRVLFPQFVWIPQLCDRECELQPTLWERFKCRLRSAKGIAYLFVQHFLGRLFFLLGYLGIALALLRKKYGAFFLLFLGGIASSYIFFFIHFEPRFSLHSTVLFPFFIAYFLVTMYDWRTKQIAILK